MLIALEVVRTEADDAQLNSPATDLGYLLHKHPDRVQSFATTQGEATVFYPVADADKCRAVLRVDGTDARVDSHTDIDRHVNTIPYAASTRLVVALGKVFGDALAGRCTARPELVDHVWDVSVLIPSVPVRGTLTPADVFEPLGWSVTARAEPLTPTEWGDSDFVTLTLSGRFTVRDSLRHIAIALPALAGDKHYFVDDDDIDKLLRHGEGWLETHPRRDSIVRGYLKNLGALARDALTRLDPASTCDEESADQDLHDQDLHDREFRVGDLQGEDFGDDMAADRRMAVGRRPLAAERIEAVAGMVRALGARSVLDVGCGEGRLLGTLSADGVFARLAGVDVSTDELGSATKRLERRRGIELWQSSLLYTDARCRGFDVVVLMEVIEHIDRGRLPVAVDSVFETMQPGAVIVTTPNSEYNPVYGITDGFRHPDHRFEFTRDEFESWCRGVAADHSYTVTTSGIGQVSDDVGTPTQCAVFRRIDSEGGVR